jgi:hypothetical protein
VGEGIKILRLWAPGSLDGIIATRWSSRVPAPHQPSAR